MGKMKYLLTIPLTPHFTPPTPIITHPHFTQPTPHTPILHTPIQGESNWFLKECTRCCSSSKMQTCSSDYNSLYYAAGLGEGQTMLEVNNGVAAGGRGVIGDGAGDLEDSSCPVQTIWQMMWYRRCACGGMWFCKY